MITCKMKGEIMPLYAVLIRLLLEECMKFLALHYEKDREVSESLKRMIVTIKEFTL